jgi:hypothetical protein
LPRSHRQRRLGAIDRLDLQLLVDAQHNSAIRRVEVKSGNFADLFDKQRIARQLKGFAAMRLQPERLSDAVHRRGRMAHCPRRAAQLQCVAPAGRG